MRKEYNDLQAVGGLTVPTSSLNLLQELKEHNENMTNNMKAEIQNSLVETLQALNIASQNEENVSPNIHHLVHNGPTTFNPVLLLILLHSCNNTASIRSHPNTLQLHNFFMK